MKMNFKNTSAEQSAQVTRAAFPFPAVARGYESDFRERLSGCGWGCWYLFIGRDHPLYKKASESIGESLLNHEITFCEEGWIGFDLAHVWSNSHHDFDYLLGEIECQVDELQRVAGE